MLLPGGIDGFVHPLCRNDAHPSQEGRAPIHVVAYEIQHGRRCNEIEAILDGARSPWVPPQWGLGLAALAHATNYTPG